MVHSIIKSIDRDEFKPHLVYFYGDKVHPEFEKLKIPMYKIDKIQRFDISAIQMLSKIIRKNKIDIVHCQHFMPMIYSFYGAKIRKKIGLICTFHSEWELEEIPMRWRLFCCLINRKIDYAVGVTSKVGTKIKKLLHIHDKRISVIFNGVNARDAERGREISPFDKELTFSESDVIIGTVGNLKRVKNQIFMIEGFNAFLKENHCARLIIVGQSFKEDIDNTEVTINNYIRNHNLSDNVYLLGYRNDIWDILRTFNIFCLTSFNEGLPISILEAMASGVPVVGTDVPGIRDVIENDTDGVLVPLNDVVKLKDAFNKISTSAYFAQKLTLNAKEKVKRLYSMEKCLYSYRELYKKMVE